MKKYNKVFKYLAIMISFITTINIIGCNHDDEIITRKNSDKSMLDRDFEKLALSEREVLNVIFNKRNTSSKKSRRNYMPNSEDICNDESFTNLASHIDSFLSKQDLLADYYENELKKLKISEEEKELLKIDMDEYMDFIRDNMSEEYYIITQKLTSDSTYIPTIKEISGNNDLKLSEKFCLVIVTEAIDYFRKQETIDKPTNQLTRKELCDRIKRIEKQMCTNSLAANVTVSVLEMIISKGGSECITGVHIAYAIYEYIECMNKADNFYTECLK